MEKEGYEETYEYSPASGSTSEAEPYQFFVVQDDGTFLINRQVQYVTQVEASKESEEGQPCTMLDAPQQFYVDVDNAGEMTVPEQFNIPEGTSSLYTSSYLLQSGTGAAVEQVNNNTEDQPKPLDNSTPNKDTTSLTEITLTDEQYRLLEQKGWVLLETNGKVYILDSLGLHDISMNEKLIEKLKADGTPGLTELDPSQFKIEYLSLEGIDNEINSVQSEGKLEPTLKTECETDLSLIVDESKEEEKEQKTQCDESCTSTDAIQATEVENLNQEPCDNWKDGNILRIRTDFCLKDFPKEIVLGKTRKGKLVCRVLKPERNVRPAEKIEEIQPPSGRNVPVLTYQDKPQTYLNDLGDEKLDRIFRMSFKESSVPCNADDVRLVEKVVKRLLQLPAVQSSIINRNMLVTKVTVIEQKSLIIESSPTLVTGKVVSLHRAWHFLHKPDLYDIAKVELSRPISETGEGHNFLHMHLHEIQRDDKFVQMAVTLDKRRLLEPSSTQQSEKIFIPDLPLNLINDTYTNNMYGYACGTCAEIFDTEKELNQHREIHKMDTDDKIKETTEENKLGIYLATDLHTKMKNYVCMQCKAKFSRLTNCQRHVKTHITDKELSGDKEMYKCKMCSCFFHHSPTLLKHIMKNHIRED